MLNPAVAITAGILALGVAIVAAYKKFEGFREVVRTVVNAAAGYFEFMINGWIKAVNLIIYGLNLLKPGKDIKMLQEISIGRMAEPVEPSDPGRNGSANIAERNNNVNISVYCWHCHYESDPATVIDDPCFCNLCNASCTVVNTASCEITVPSTVKLVLLLITVGAAAAADDGIGAALPW